MAISTVATMEAATAATMAADTVTITAAPQFTITTTSPPPTSIVEHQRLLRQGSLTLPAQLGQRSVEEAWFGIQQSQIEQDDNRATNVPRAGAVQRQTTGVMTLEEFLVDAGVLSPVSTLEQSCEEYQNINDTRAELGPPCYIGRPVISLGEGGGSRINVPTYPVTLPQSSTVDIFFLPGLTISSSYQPPAVCYGGWILNGAGGGGLVERMGLPMSQRSSDVVEVDGVNQFGMQIGGAQNQIVSRPVQEVVERRQRRMLKNRAAAARSRGRREAYIVELKAEIDRITEENVTLRQAVAAMEDKLKQKKIEREELKHRVKRLKRNRSWSQ